MSDTLDKLAAVLEERKSASPESSYVAGLYAAGLEAVLEKVDEEAAEVIAALSAINLLQRAYDNAWFSKLSQGDIGSLLGT